MMSAKLLQNVLPFNLSREDAGKLVVEKLRELRRSLSPAERVFEDVLREAESVIQYQASLTPAKRIESVIRAVAKNAAHTVPEIAEDVGLPQADTRQIVLELVEQGVLEKRERYTVGGSSRQILYWVKGR